MTAKDQLAAQELYIDLMQEAKMRLFSIEFAAKGHSRLPDPIVRETCYLQLRLLCEVIALACLVAHGDIQATQTKKLRKEWAADAILEALDGIHPYFYPRPFTRTGSEPKVHQFAEVTSGFLTKSELKALNGKCGDVLHRGAVKTLRPLEREAKLDFSDVIAWTNKIIKLLGTHFISLLDGKTHYLVILLAGKDGDQVQMSVATSVGPSLPPPSGQT